MKKTETHFDAEMLKQIPDLSEAEEDEEASMSKLALHLDWFLVKLKQELNVAVTQKDKARADELVAKVAEVQVERDDVWAALRTATTPPKNKPKKESTTKKDLNVPAPTKSMQFDLFRQFINDKGDVSNTIEVWDLIPKYFLTAAQVKALRSDKGLAAPVTWEYTMRERDTTARCTVEIQPALINVGKTGKPEFLAFFPGSTEEIIEEILKKLLVDDQQLGIHDPKQGETWVRFSLRMIERELAARGKTRNRQEIRQSLEIMAKTHLTWVKNGKAAYTGSLISELITVDRSDYENDGNAMWAARLPSIISSAINKLQYRQFNYLRLMILKDSLSRWIYKRLVNRFVQASETDHYEITFGELKQSSALLQQSDDRGNRRKVLDALQELKDGGVLADFTHEERKQGRQVVDVKYKLIASPAFIKDQKEANLRHKNHYSTAQQNGLELR
ncbi:hypothetical protein [Cellvibrio sp. QJXJ]|uniref:hypothetical protein n=1 Tax=Cellvibrio sp. QJXJ TaxID=2964606 RepID=UPI0021C2AE42|nr:hypothetical protein [Cellvibrio sp. QJXJ]UUA75288.1 hypothetical protein NNX04_22800 [Cellvibrio sp. QJXJ]